MDDMYVFLGGVVGGALLILLAQFMVYVVHPWFKALLVGARVPAILIVAMRFRGSPPSLLIDAHVQLRKRGRVFTMAQVETTYVAHKQEVPNAAALVRLMEDLFPQDADTL